MSFSMPSMFKSPVGRGLSRRSERYLKGKSLTSGRASPSWRVGLPARVFGRTKMSARDVKAAAEAAQLYEVKPTDFAVGEVK